MCYIYQLYIEISSVEIKFYDQRRQNGKLMLQTSMQKSVCRKKQVFPIIALHLYHSKLVYCTESSAEVLATNRPTDMYLISKS